MVVFRYGKRKWPGRIMSIEGQDQVVISEMIWNRKIGGWVWPDYPKEFSYDRSEVLSVVIPEVIETRRAPAKGAYTIKEADK